MEPIRFFNEAIEVVFSGKPRLEKKPGLPDAFAWRGEQFEILEVLSEWHDYHRRGRMARNMSSEHTLVSERRGSWGVGKDYYRVRTQDGRIFDLYFDRAPIDVDRRKGNWFLFQELREPS